MLHLMQALSVTAKVGLRPQQIYTGHSLPRESIQVSLFIVLQRRSRSLVTFINPLYMYSRSTCVDRRPVGRFRSRRDMIKPYQKHCAESIILTGVGAVINIIQMYVLWLRSFVNPVHVHKLAMP